MKGAQARTADPITLEVIRRSLIAIGADGGSVAWLDSGGALHKGPESAGADPDPACYGQAGTKPTSTDAHVVLGHVADDFFAEGSMPLLSEHAAEAVRRTVAEPLGLTTEVAAEGMLQILDNLMLGAIRLVTIEKGFDLRDFASVGFGGGGLLHVVELARELGMKRAIVPSFPGVPSAWGMLTVDRVQDRSRTILQPLAALGEHELREALASIQEEKLAGYCEEGLEVGDVMFEYFLDLQYYGHVHAIAVSKGKLLEFRVCDRTLLKAGHVVAGPAVMEEVTSTTILPADALLVVDEFLNLIVSINDNGAV